MQDDDEEDEEFFAFAVVFSLFAAYIMKGDLTDALAVFGAMYIFRCFFPNFVKGE